MNYTVKELAELAGISSRTIRYYDKIGLLKPQRINANGYRVYGNQEVALLQQILFYKELEFPLEEIRKFLQDPEYNEQEALEEQKKLMIQKRDRIERLMCTLEQTLQEMKGERTMSNEEKFEAFKQEQLKENNERYEKELKELYDEETIRKSNEKFENMTEDEMETFQLIAKQILEELKVARETKDPAGEKSQALAAKHREWLDYTWPSYTKEAHRGLADLYVSDPRFIQYYDDVAGEGAAEFFRQAIYVYTE